MFFGKNQTPEQAQFRSQIITFILVQGVIFSSTYFIHRVIHKDYGLVLAAAGFFIFLTLIPSNMSVSPYTKTAYSKFGTQRHEMEKNRIPMTGREIIERFVIGLIPLSIGVLLLMR